MALNVEKYPDILDNCNPKTLNNELLAVCVCASKNGVEKQNCPIHVVDNCDYITDDNAERVSPCDSVDNDASFIMPTELDNNAIVDINAQIKLSFKNNNFDVTDLSSYNKTCDSNTVLQSSICINNNTDDDFLSKKANTFLSDVKNKSNSSFADGNLKNISVNKEMCKQKLNLNNLLPNTDLDLSSSNVIDAVTNECDLDDDFAEFESFRTKAQDSCEVMNDNFASWDSAFKSSNNIKVIDEDFADFNLPESEVDLKVGVSKENNEECCDGANKINITEEYLPNGIITNKHLNTLSENCVKLIGDNSKERSCNDVTNTLDLVENKLMNSGTMLNTETNGITIEKANTKIFNKEIEPMFKKTNLDTDINKLDNIDIILKDQLLVEKNELDDVNIILKDRLLVEKNELDSEYTKDYKTVTKDNDVTNASTLQPLAHTEQDNFDDDFGDFTKVDSVVTTQHVTELQSVVEIPKLNKILTKDLYSNAKPANVETSTQGKTAGILERLLLHLERALERAFDVDTTCGEVHWSTDIGVYEEDTCDVDSQLAVADVADPGTLATGGDTTQAALSSPGGLAAGHASLPCSSIWRCLTDLDRRASVLYGYEWATSATYLAYLRAIQINARSSSSSLCALPATRSHPSIF